MEKWQTSSASAPSRDIMQIAQMAPPWYLVHHTDGTASIRAVGRETTIFASLPTRFARLLVAAGNTWRDHICPLEDGLNYCRDCANDDERPDANGVLITEGSIVHRAIDADTRPGSTFDAMNIMTGEVIHLVDQHRGVVVNWDDQGLSWVDSVTLVACSGREKICAVCGAGGESDSGSESD